MTESILAPPGGSPTTTTPAAPTSDQRVAALEARLAQLEPLAQRGAAAAAADRLALDAQVSRLSAADQETVARLSEADRAAVTARLLASPGAFRAPPVIGGGPPSPVGAPVDFNSLINDPAAYNKAKRDHPDQWADFARAVSGFGSATSSGAFFSRAPTAAQKNASLRGHRR